MNTSNSKIEKIQNAFILYILPSILIIYIFMYRLGEHLYPIIYGDEYGYWAAGSFFAGLNWSDITTINPYYGYGYGFFLAILLKYISSPLVCYRVALYFNVIAMALVYIIIVKCIKILQQFFEIELSKLYTIILAICITCYPSYLQYVNYTMSEIPTILLTWVGMLFALKYLSKREIKYLIITIITALLMTMVHLRNVGFWIVVLLIAVVNICISKNKKYSLGIVILFAMLAGIFIVFKIKDVYQSSYYVQLEGIQHVNDNEVSGLIYKILGYTSFSSLTKLFEGLVGKFYYLLITTWGFGLIGFIQLPVIIRNAIKRRDLAKWESATMIGVLYCMTMILVCTVVMLNYEERFDLLLYGRYFENCIPYIMLIGVFLYLKLSKESVVLKIAPLVMILLVKWAEILQDYTLYKGNVFINMTFLAAHLMKENYAAGTYLKCASYVAIAVVIFSLIKKFKREAKIGVIVVFMCMTIINISSARYVLDEGFYSWSIKENKSELPLYELILEKDISDKLFYFSEGYVLMADGLQFLIKDEKISVIDNLSGEKYVLTSVKGTTNMEELGYSEMGRSQRVILWSKCQ